MPPLLTIISTEEWNGTHVNMTAGNAQGGGNMWGPPDEIYLSNVDEITPTIQLHAGWNLISLPKIPEALDVLSIMYMEGGNWNSVWLYESGTWKRYDLSGPEFLNDLIIMEPGRGYWIDMKSNDTWILGA